MAYTVTKLITNAYYASGIVGRDFQTVSGSQLNDGLDFFNEILSDKYVEKGMLPYYTKYNFNSIAGTEKYFIPNLIEVETLVFFINTVRYAMSKVDRIYYYGSSRADNVESLPFTWHMERELGGSSLYLYFKPDQAYPMELWGQFGLADATNNTDLELVYDQFYISYLKYALAKRICINFDCIIPPGVSDQLLQYNMMISKRVSPLDLRMQKTTTFGSSNSVNYGQANLGKGWTAP